MFTVMAHIISAIVMTATLLIDPHLFLLELGTCILMVIFGVILEIWVS